MHVTSDSGLIPRPLNGTGNETTIILTGFVPPGIPKGCVVLTLQTVSPSTPCVAAHKQLFLREGVVDAALHTLRQSPLAHVRFKALAVLRLLVDKQGVEGVGGGKGGKGNGSRWEGAGLLVDKQGVEGRGGKV